MQQYLGHQLSWVELRVDLAELITRFPGLRLAVVAAEIPMCTDMFMFCVHSLPVAWD